MKTFLKKHQDSITEICIISLMLTFLSVFIAIGFKSLFTPTVTKIYFIFVAVSVCFNTFFPFFLMELPEERRKK